jgi:cytochrome c oxidase assembly factor CtaG/putative copper export protein
VSGAPPRTRVASGAPRERPQTDAAPAAARWVWAAGVAGLLVLALALLLGGGAAGTGLTGLTDPGTGTRWGLPVATLVMDVAATVAVGFFLLAVLLPAPKNELSGTSLQALRTGSVAAALWCFAAAASLLLTLSDLIGRPVPDALAGDSLRSFVTTVDEGQALALVVVLAAVLVPTARLTLKRSGAAAVLLLSLATVVPPALTGHAAAGDYHHPAATSLIVHVLATVLWVGGLVAIMTYARGPARDLARVVTTYSAIAFGSAVMVGASGFLNASLRLSSPADLVSTSYGWLVLGKTGAFAALVAFGAWHRRRTLPSLQQGRRGAFRRIAAGEIAVMAGTIGLAVALSRTPTPVPEVIPDATRARQLLGYPPPPELTAGRLLTEVYPDGLFFLLATAMVVLYLAGVRRLSRRGDRWPVTRTLAWLGGVLVLCVSTLSGLMTYGMTMLSVHMTQHMIEAMAVPPLLVLGAPVTLALRAIRPAPRGQTGPRELLAAALGSRVLRVLTHPLVAFTIFVTAAPMVYFSGLFPYAMYHHTGHLLMSLHFILGGYLFYEVIIGLDPLPRRPPHVARLVMVLAAAGFHAFFGVALMQASRLIAGDWYAELSGDIAWLPDTLADQRIAGQITWGLGELPALLVLLVLLYQWAKSDEREAARRDRRDTGKELAEYNAYLASLSQGTRRRR